MRHCLPIALLTVLSTACAEEEPDPIEEDPPTLQTGAAVTLAVVYESVSFEAAGMSRPWLPYDVTPSTHGELWVVQRMERLPDFDENSECTSRSQTGAPNDCLGLQGSTVAIRNPTSNEPATDNRANLVVDANAWHFMRRPAGIAFGVAETTLQPDDPRALDPVTGEPLIDEPTGYRDIFATCHEHWTGNFTDFPPFIGPSLWTADPEIYNGVNGTFSWSNGSHLDMVHATQDCVGIAWEQGNVYWVFNGAEGSLDRYDFGAPHYPGAEDHSDGEVTRYTLDSPLARTPNVPSNLVMQDNYLYVADTGNGRVVRLDLDQAFAEDGTFLTFESLVGDLMEATVDTVVDSAALQAAWGDSVEPSGLAFFDADTVVVANHASGHLSLFSPEGEELRTIDTELGPGIGGLTVMDGVIYFTHITERKVYRVDVETEEG